jgi:hypothetical protein
MRQKCNEEIEVSSLEIEKPATEELVFQSITQR